MPERYSPSEGEVAYSMEREEGHETAKKGTGPEQTCCLGKVAVIIHENTQPDK